MRSRRTGGSPPAVRWGIALTVLGTIVLGGTAPVAAGESDGPRLRPRDVVETIDNPYFPLLPGSRWVYEGVTKEGTETIVVEVNDETKRVQGIDAVVVHDTVRLDGEIIEDTYDWYAQDVRGNVWYLGEDTHEYENGVPVNSKGAWQAGVDGAEAGIVMKANPRVGDEYRQEHYRGVAEDRAKVLSVTASARVPFGSFSGDVVKTKDFTPLEPGVVEHKYYARGVGPVLEVAVSRGGERVELIEHTSP